MSKVKTYKEGWLEYVCPTKEYVATEKRLTKFLNKGCKFVGIVARSRRTFSLYYYSPKLFVDGENEHSFLDRYWDCKVSSQKLLAQKPWDIMTEKEKQDDWSLMGRVFTEHEEDGNKYKKAHIVVVLSLLPQKDDKLPPKYDCLHLDYTKWDDEEPETGLTRRHLTSRELRGWDENDLTFLICYGAPRQIVIDEIKKRQQKAEKQINNWKKTLKQVQEENNELTQASPH